MTTLPDTSEAQGADLVTQSDLDALEKRLGARLIEQDHRAVPVAMHWLETRELPLSDARRQAAWKALLWRLLSPTAAATAGVGAGTVIAILTLLEFRRQNVTLAEQSMQTNEALKLNRSQLEVSRDQVKLAKEQIAAARNDVCQASPRCESFGLCSFDATDQRCVAGADSDCQMSAVCEKKEHCKLVGKRCGLSSDACMERPACLKRAECEPSADGQSCESKESFCQMLSQLQQHKYIFVAKGCHRDGSPEALIMTKIYPGQFKVFDGLHAAPSSPQPTP